SCSRRAVSRQGSVRRARSQGGYGARRSGIPARRRRADDPAQRRQALGLSDGGISVDGTAITERSVRLQADLRAHEKLTTVGTEETSVVVLLISDPLPRARCGWAHPPPAPPSHHA